MLTIVRDRRTDHSILGRLFIGGTRICYTLENASKAIPAGWYTVENSYSPKFKRELPLLYSLKVQARRGVRIHSGNTWKDSSACVLVGMGRDDVNEQITESADAEKMVTMLCRSVHQLAIVEQY